MAFYPWSVLTAAHYCHTPQTHLLTEALPTGQWILTNFSDCLTGRSLNGVRILNFDSTQVSGYGYKAPLLYSNLTRTYMPTPWSSEPTPPFGAKQTCNTNAD